jgi:hypothetical protein
MSNQSPTGSGKDQFPHHDIANKDEGNSEEARPDRRPQHVERGGEVHADNDQKWSDDDIARQERGLPQQAPDSTDGGTSSRTAGKAR